MLMFAATSDACVMEQITHKHPTIASACRQAGASKIDIHPPDFIHRLFIYDLFLLVACQPSFSCRCVVNRSASCGKPDQPR
jgi:hypothetical protein